MHPLDTDFIQAPIVSIHKYWVLPCRYSLSVKVEELSVELHNAAFLILTLELHLIPHPKKRLEKNAYL